MTGFVDVCARLRKTRREEILFLQSKLLGHRCEATLPVAVVHQLYDNLRMNHLQQSHTSRRLTVLSSNLVPAAIQLVAVKATVIIYTACLNEETRVRPL